MTDASALPQSSLSPMEMEFFLTAIETAARIRKRSQFYLWTQGALQNFVPHESLLACVGAPGSASAHTEISTCCIFNAEQEQKLCNGEDSLVALLAREWDAAGQQPVVVLTSRGAAGAALAACGFNSALCHGFQANSQQNGSFFVFLELPNRPINRLSYMLELFLPHLHMALMGLSQGENLSQGAEKLQSGQINLSAREADVLHWIRAGKTNYEIGIILSISPLTVKNHVQKILRKLNVSNRAQAAALAGQADPASPPQHQAIAQPELRQGMPAER